MIAVVLFAAVAIADAQWAAILACPKVSVPQSANGTGVVVGIKDGYAYLLTAAHVVGPFDRVSVEFTSPRTYPKPAWYPDKAEVIARWPDPDLALVRFGVGKRTLPVLPLAPAWQRPKAFPSRAVAIGATGNQAATARADAILGKEFVSREKKQPAFFWRTENPPQPGRSGGPLLDARGQVIGIAVAASGGSGYYAHHDEIVAALKRDGYSWLFQNR